MRATAQHVGAVLHYRDSVQTHTTATLCAMVQRHALSAAIVSLLSVNQIDGVQVVYSHVKLLQHTGSNGAVHQLVKEVVEDTENAFYVECESSTLAFMQTLRLAGEDDARRARGTRLCPIDWLVGLPSNATHKVHAAVHPRFKLQSVALPASCLGVHVKAEVFKYVKPVHLSRYLWSNVSQWCHSF